MGIAKRHTERGWEQAGMSREGQRTMEKVLENTVRDTAIAIAHHPEFHARTKHIDITSPIYRTSSLVAENVSGSVTVPAPVIAVFGIRGL